MPPEQGAESARDKPRGEPLNGPGASVACDVTHGKTGEYSDVSQCRAAKKVGGATRPPAIHS